MHVLTVCSANKEKVFMFIWQARCDYLIFIAVFIRLCFRTNAIKWPIPWNVLGQQFSYYNPVTQWIQYTIVGKIGMLGLHKKFRVTQNGHIFKKLSGIELTQFHFLILCFLTHDTYYFDLNTQKFKNNFNCQSSLKLLSDSLIQPKK